MPEQQIDIKRGWLDTADVAERCGVSREEVRLWMRVGDALRDGTVVKLEAIWIGSFRATREEWLQAFLDATGRTEVEIDRP